MHNDTLKIATAVAAIALAANIIASNWHMAIVLSTLLVANASSWIASKMG